GPIKARVERQQRQGGEREDEGGMLWHKLPLPGLQKDVALRDDGDLVISGGHLARSEENLEGEQSEQGRDEGTPRRVRAPKDRARGWRCHGKDLIRFGFSNKGIATQSPDTCNDARSHSRTRRESTERRD